MSVIPRSGPSQPDINRPKLFAAWVYAAISATFLLIAVAPIGAQALPDMRPALLGNSPKSLINMINPDSLVKHGQGDAKLMFSCFVTSNGYLYDIITYRGTGNCTALMNEVVRCSENARGIPAVYHHVNRAALMSGTIVFAVGHGKPHLRIFLNQEPEHLGHLDDFISPQWVFIPGDKFEGIRYPPLGVGFSGVVGLQINVDASGTVTGSKIAIEVPAGKGFGQEVMSKVGQMTFLPGYLHGKPVSCSATLPIIFQRGGGGASNWHPG